MQYPLSEEREPLSSHQHATVSAGLLVDTNLDTSVPDTYRPPPAPIPYETRPATPSGDRDTSRNKTEVVLQTPNTESVEDTTSGNTLDTKIKDIECDEKAELNIELVASKEVEDDDSDELKKSTEPMVPPLLEEEDLCPTCLEGMLKQSTDFLIHLEFEILKLQFRIPYAEYDAENPKMITKCDHHFHLACILEWMERSDTCPVCDQVCVIAIIFVII